MKKNNFNNAAFVPVAKVGDFEVAIGRELVQIINMMAMAKIEMNKDRSRIQAKLDELEISERELRLERSKLDLEKAKFEFELYKEDRRREHYASRRENNSNK